MFLAVERLNFGFLCVFVEQVLHVEVEDAIYLRGICKELQEKNARDPKRKVQGTLSRRCEEPSRICRDL